MSTKPTARRVRTRHEFIKAHRHKHSVQAMCRLLGVAPSGYYAWLAQPVSGRAQEDARLLRLIRALFTASQGIYGPVKRFTTNTSMSMSSSSATRLGAFVAYTRWPASLNAGSCASITVPGSMLSLPMSVVVPAARSWT
jgi:hypothetical protein